jgi:hypothetical protein
LIAVTIAAIDDPTADHVELLNIATIESSPARSPQLETGGIRYLE